jgi:hypothetical protein
MAIQYTIASEGDTLLVNAAGYDETLEEVQEYALAVIDACRENGCTRVLCDETALEYRLGTFDTYQSAQFVATYGAQIEKVAIVCSPRFSADARFWEDVAVNRGLTVRVFREGDAARAWLRGGRPSQ